MFEYFVYIIKGTSSNNKTKFYIGFTTNLDRRIKQHNRELVGGAKATFGYKWQYCGIIANIGSKIQGLQIEWRLKFSTSKTGIVNRFNSFFNYVDKHLKASPKSDKFKKKLFLYLDRSIIPSGPKHIINIPLNIIIIDVSFNQIIMNHISN